jgi:hypothetical protein
MTLIDAYCLFNRIRGSGKIMNEDNIQLVLFNVLALISPEDLLRACQLFERLKLSIHLRQLSTGVYVIHMDILSYYNILMIIIIESL